MEGTRESYSSSIVVGRKHTGKSTMLANIADKYPKTSKVLIIDVNGSPVDILVMLTPVMHHTDPPRGFGLS